MSTSLFEQVGPTRFPSGYGILVATARVQPEIFSRAFGLTFVEGYDNLDWYEAALIRLRSGRLIMLMRHRGSPDAGTEVHVDAEDDFLAALREFLEAFDLSAEDLSWMRDDIPAEDLRPALHRAHV